MTLPQGKRLLIDGDVLRYRCGFAAEKTHYLVEELDGTFQKFDTHKSASAYCSEGSTIWSRKEVQPEEFAYNAVNTVLESFVNKFNPVSVDIFLSDSKTFRHRLAVTKPYKGNRDDVHKPVYYKQLGDFLFSRGAIVQPDVEADDCLAMCATEDPKNTIIVTIDKDLLQVPGNHYNWVTDEFVVQSKKGADFELAAQILAGDSTDNIPGLPGCGAVKADKIITGATSTKDLMSRIVEAYKAVGDNWKEYLWEQLRLVYLLRKYEEKEANEILGFALKA